MVGIKKTRTMATWAERRGFGTSIHERLFDAAFRRQDREPAVALCGVDYGEARRAFAGAGFPLVIEAGLGRDHRSFRTMRLHTLPGSKPAAELWRRDTANEDVTMKPAYEKLLADGDAACFVRNLVTVSGYAIYFHYDTKVGGGNIGMCPWVSVKGED